mmetsp:Transcript_112878/g.324414  ORF Transcript_112878/g.324414 Transcript_112878/m.324414 type:complete len:205 (+) Transcript_112878:669-1283(+)
MPCVTAWPNERASYLSNIFAMLPMAWRCCGEGISVSWMSCHGGCQRCFPRARHKGWRMSCMLSLSCNTGIGGLSMPSVDRRALASTGSPPRASQIQCTPSVSCASGMRHSSRPLAQSLPVDCESSCHSMCRTPHTGWRSSASLTRGSWRRLRCILRKLDDWRNSNRKKFQTHCMHLRFCVRVVAFALGWLILCPRSLGPPLRKR